MTWKIPLFRISWDEEDVKATVEAIRRGMSWTDGPEVERFEFMIAEYIGAEYCVCFNSGTSALHSALLTHGIGNGDEVIVPSFTFIATCNATLFVGAKPVFADIEKKTLGLDSEDVEKKINENTKAIVPVHYGGCPCRIKEIKKITEKNNLILIEDAAEALGAKIKEKKVGTFGASAMFSFCQNKIITTGEGGAIVTNSKNIYEKLKLIRSHGRAENGDYFSSTECMDYVTLGYNFRMSDITASLGISQLRKAEKLIRMRRENAQYFTKKLNEIEEITTLTPPKDYHCVYQMYPIKVSAEFRDKLMKYLAERGIMTKAYFSPVHLTHFYSKDLRYTCKLPVTEEISRRVLTLPIHPTLTQEEMDHIIEEVKKFFTRKP